MATNHVNLDALIPRSDFDVTTDEKRAKSTTDKIKISDLEQVSFFYPALRKPDFQRETCEWKPDRVAGLIRSFIQDEMIPAVILWENQGLNFVIDGSHRLSALIAWVQDDYGTGTRSQEFFNHDISSEQYDAAEKARKLVEKEFGTYESHKDAVLHPEKYGPDVLERARRFSRLTIYVQWVEGNVKAAQDSFLRINQRSATIDKDEMEFIRTRREPRTIAARAIIRKGAGHPYWGNFSEVYQESVRTRAETLHSLLFVPPVKSPIEPGPLPPGGNPHARQALKMVSDFIALCVGAPERADDLKGERTTEYLARTERVMQLLVSKEPHSLGIHPAVYFYSWSGSQQPVVFLAWAAILIDFDRKKKLDLFTESRKVLEQFLIENRILVSQVVRKFGANPSGEGKLREFYNGILHLITEGCDSKAIKESLVKDPAYSYLQPNEQPEQAKTGTKLSPNVKSGLVIKSLIEKADECTICGGLIPPQTISWDHKERAQDGGRSVASNIGMTHPYCNTGYKEKKHSQAIKSQKP